MPGQLEIASRPIAVRHILGRKRAPVDVESILTSGTTLLDTLLKEQQSLTAVERFSQKHSNAELPAQQQYYQDLIPLTKPTAGEQYAFSVDLDACTGCKGCVSACHNLNGLDDGEIWRNVGLIESSAPKMEIVARLDEMVTPTGTCNGSHYPEIVTYQQTVTTACHHCVEPGCLQGCPVLAYEKDAVTGLVRHLDDQCIGCQYCVLKCPYDVPKYHAKKGIVRKCDMCHSRLTAGEAPACVQACPNEAIRITLVRKAEVKAETKPGDSLLPGAFDSTYTFPTTRYTSKRGPVPASARPADADALRLEHTHWPLVGMLIFTQAGAGLFLFDAIVRCAALQNPGAVTNGAAPTGPWLTLGAFALLQVGLGVSVFHLGKPLKAWRAFLGWRTSWMSREILAFGPFAGLGAAATGLAMLHFHRELLHFFALQGLIPGTGEYAAAIASAGPVQWVLLKIQWLLHAAMNLAPAWVEGVLYAPGPLATLSVTTASLGFVGVFCSTMIYVDTRRPFWRSEVAFPKFFGSLFWIGAAASASICAGCMAFERTSDSFGILASITVTILVAAYKLWSEHQWLAILKRGEDAVDLRSMQLYVTLQPQVVKARFDLGVAGGIAFPLAGVAAWTTSSYTLAFVLLTIGFMLSLLSEIAERMLFFRCVQAPKMPGTVAPALALAPETHGH